MSKGSFLGDVSARVSNRFYGFEGKLPYKEVFKAASLIAVQLGNLTFYLHFVHVLTKAAVEVGGLNERHD